MNIKNISLYVFCLSLFVLFSCATATKEVVETEEPIAVEPPKPVISAKKIETGRDKSGAVTGYRYVSLDGGTVFATETFDGSDGYILEGKIPDGLIIQYYDDEGNIAAELNYNAGKLEGVIKEYFPDGSLSFVKNYKAGFLNGPVREYYPNGIVKEEANYINGDLNGTLRKYSDSGTLLSRAEYYDGELSGVYKEFYVNGKTKKEIEYMNNKKEGLEKEYDPNGILLSEYNYSMGKLEGRSKKYYEDGSIQMIIHYSDDLQHGETHIFSNNNSDSPIYIDVYKKGKRTQRRAYSQGKLLFTL